MSAKDIDSVSYHYESITFVSIVSSAPFGFFHGIAGGRRFLFGLSFGTGTPGALLGGFESIVATLLLFELLLVTSFLKFYLIEE